MAEAGEFVTIRRLPDGPEQRATVSRHTDGQLLLALQDGASAIAFDAGTPVEIDTPEALYMGEVNGPPDALMVAVTIDHWLDRASLREIEKIWNGHGGNPC